MSKFGFRCVIREPDQNVNLQYRKDRDKYLNLSSFLQKLVIEVPYLDTKFTPDRYPQEGKFINFCPRVNFQSMKNQSTQKKMPTNLHAWTRRNTKLQFPNSSLANSLTVLLSWLSLPLNGLFLRNWIGGRVGWWEAVGALRRWSATRIVSRALESGYKIRSGWKWGMPWLGSATIVLTCRLYRINPMTRLRMPSARICWLKRKC